MDLSTTNPELFPLVFVLGASFFVAVFHLALWALRRDQADQEPWVALWALLSSALIGAWLVQLSTTDPELAKLSVRLQFSGVLLLVPTLFRMSWSMARAYQWRRAGRALFVTMGTFAVLSPLTGLFVVGEGHLREGLLGGVYLGFSPGALVIPMMAAVWLVYVGILVILWRGRMDRVTRRIVGATYTCYLLFGTVEALDGFGAIVAPGVLPYALLIESIGLTVLGVFRYAQAEQELRRRSQELGTNMVALDKALIAAEAAVHARARFLATMSHELRTPLNGVIGITQLLGQTRLDETQSDYVRVLHDSGDQLLTLIDEVLDYTSLDSGRLLLSPERTPLQELISGRLDAIRPEATAKGLRLTLVCGVSLPEWVKVDPRRLEQVLDKLLDNAVRFTDHGQVLLQVRSERGGICFAIEDTGPGISPEQQARLFQAFTQADDSTTRAHGGTGIGLALSAALVQAMGGVLSVDSRLGQGSRFSFTLPLREAAKPAQTHRSTPPAAGFVLVVEDNRINQLVVRKMLESLGYVVEVAENGAVALEKLSGAQLVLMDCQMPVMDGYEATRAIRGQGVEVPIIGLSANALPGDAERAIGAGMDAYITKPVSVDRLAETIQLRLAS